MYRLVLGALGALVLMSGGARDDTPAGRARLGPQTPSGATRPEDPRAVVRAAARAVERGDAPRLRGEWSTRIRADPTDRAATLGLATLARLTYAFDDAERGYRQLIDRSATNDPYVVYARLGLAQGQDAHGRKRGMKELFDEARAGARTLGDRAAEGEALFWKAHALAQVYGGDFALAHLDTALRVIPADALDLRAACRCRRAQVMAVMGRQGAVDTLAAARDAARDALTRTGDVGAEAICLRAHGTAQWIRGANDSSIVTYDSLAALRRRMHDRSNLAVALVLRADVLRGQGDYGEAMRSFREALVEARASRNLYIEATVTLGLGGMSLTLNDHAAAARQVARAVAAFDAAGDSGAAMLARSFYPFISLAAGDHARARDEVHVVLPWARQVGDWGHVQALYTQLGAIEMRAGDWAAAERALGDALDAARKLGPSAEGSVAFPRGRLALYRGDLTGAEQAFTRHLAGLDSARHLERYETRTYLADTYARRGDLTRAERELRTASDELDTWRLTLADRELRTLVFQAGATEVNDRNASVARVLAALATGGRSEAALALSERRRARELADRVIRTRSLRVMGESSIVRPSVERARTAGQGLGETLPRPLDAATLAPAIPDERTALLEYVTGVMGAPTTVFLVTRPSPGADSANNRPHVRAHVLAPADSLVGDIARFVATTEQAREPTELARTLGTLLLAPALRDLPADVTRLVIVPDGPLHRVPWDALRLADGRYVAERFAVGLAPSVRVLAELRRRTPEATENARPVRILAYGDPAFADERQSAVASDSDLEDDIYRSAFASAGGLPRLRASAREAKLAAGYADDPEVRLRAAASAASLKRTALDQFRVVHFATHAIVDERSPTRTALALAPGEGESGFVGAADLAALSMDVDLVVLSTCRSAGGVVVDGEGVQGLTGPLIEAGARSVLATQWRIGDRTTVGFVDEFYRAMARGLPVSDALRAAKLDAIRRGAPTREWAAFTTVGDPLTLIPLRSRPPSTSRQVLGLAGAAVALGLAGYWLRIRKRRRGDAR